MAMVSKPAVTRGLINEEAGRLSTRVRGKGFFFQKEWPIWGRIGEYCPFFSFF